MPAPEPLNKGASRPEALGPSAVQRALFVVEYALFRALMGLFWVLGLERASNFGGWVARKFGPGLPVTRRARRNMARALPELDEAARERAIADMWDNLGRTFAEYPHLGKIWSVKPGARVEIVGFKEAEQAVRGKGKGGIFVSGHCGNWETMPGVFGDHGVKAALVYRAPIIFGWCTRLPRSHYRVAATDVFDPAPTGNHVKDVYDLTLKINQALEARIRAEPWNWLWLHNRWPKD